MSEKSKATNRITPTTSQTITSTLIPSYVMHLKVINKDSIKDFKIDEDNRRMIREGKVKDILSGIEERIHFSAPFVVNEKDEKLLLIDGNHRFEAIKRMIGINKGFQIKVWLAVYRNLTEEEKRGVYKLWNIGTTQSATDFLQAYFQTIPYGREMLRLLPVSIYGSSYLLPIRTLVGAHVISKRNKAFNGGYQASKEQTVTDFVNIQMDDIKTIREFCDFMSAVFGAYNKEDNKMFYGITPISVFYRIWYDNRELDQKKLCKAFKRVFAENASKWSEIVRSGSRVTQGVFYSQALTALRSYRANLQIRSYEDNFNGHNQPSEADNGNEAEATEA